jgi:hypothetical protein
MNRRALLASALAAPLASPPGFRASVAEAVPVAAWRRFELTTRITLLDSHGPAQLWLPLAQTAGGYQTALNPRWTGNGRADLVYDTCYGAAMLRGSCDARSTLRGARLRLCCAKAGNGPYPTGTLPVPHGAGNGKDLFAGAIGTTGDDAAHTNG